MHKGMIKKVKKKGGVSILVCRRMTSQISLKKAMEIVEIKVAEFVPRWDLYVH